MATLTAYSSFSSLDVSTWVGVVTKATATTVSLFNPYGAESVTYKGSFHYSYGYLSSGKVTQATIYNYGEKYFQVKGSYDAVTYDFHASYDSHDEFTSYLFAGNDIFNGSKFNDFISFPSFGNDTFNGKAGNDYLATNVGFTSKVDGGAGNDFIDIYGYFDTVTGGKGADIFEVNWISDSSAPKIKDFKLTDGDLLDVSVSSFSLVADAIGLYENLNGTFEVYSNQVSLTNGTSFSQDYNDYVIYDKKTGNLYFDLDANGNEYRSELLATFTNKPKFTASDIANNVLVFNDSDYQDAYFDNFLEMNFIYPI